MKKLIILLLSISWLTANAQRDPTTTLTIGTVTRTTAAGTTVTKVNKTFGIDSNSVVKDSAGVRYTYKAWHNRIISGDYRLRSRNLTNDSTREFTLVKTTEQEKARMLAFIPKPDESGFIKTGEKLDLFSAKDITGYKITPKDLEGKVVVLNFWFISCVPCRQEIPELNKIALSYANDPGVVFIAVALDQKDELQTFIKDNPFAYHIVADGKEIAKSFAIKGYPTNVILDKNSVVKFHNTGFGPNMLSNFKKDIDEVK